MSGMLYSIPVILTGYRIVQIEDEATPLAQAAKSGYYGDTVAGMLGIGVLLLLVIYFILCRKYQKRIIELQKLNSHLMDQLLQERLLLLMKKFSMLKLVR